MDQDQSSSYQTDWPLQTGIGTGSADFVRDVACFCQRPTGFLFFLFCCLWGYGDAPECHVSCLACFPRSYEYDYIEHISCLASCVRCNHVGATFRKNLSLSLPLPPFSPAAVGSRTSTVLLPIACQWCCTKGKGRDKKTSNQS